MPARMHRGCIVVGIATVALMATATPLFSQSLFLDRGQRGAEAIAGWSFGPSSDGLETRVGVALDGRFDVGVSINRYTVDFDDGSSSAFNEVAPYVRWFAAKEGEGIPVSLSFGAQYFTEDFAGDDSGWYVMVGPAVHKRLRLADTVALYPFVGFGLVGESYTFGDSEPDRALYLARTLGLLFTVALDPSARSQLRIDIEEQSFRRETYRAARLGFVRRF